jgi:hypothetical protein
LIKMTRARVAAAAVTLALTAGGIGLTAASATASSSGCTGATGALAGSCSDEVTASGVGWAVHRGLARPGTAIVAVADAAGVTDGSTDFYAQNTNGNASERTFEYAPGGRESGLCMSSQAWFTSGLVLQHCNGSASQQFYGIGDTQDDTASTNGGIQWLNVASGKVVVVSGKSVVMRGLDAAASTSGSYFHWAS